MRADCARTVAMASAGGAMLALVAVALRQVGAVEHLPDPAGEMFDSDRIVMSKAAHPMGVPDGVLGLGSYAVTAGLLMAGSPVLRAKLVCDAGAAGFNVVRQVVVFRKVCSWCMIAAVCTVPMVYFGLRAERA